MDKRILTKVKILESAKQNQEAIEAAKKAEQEARNKAYIKSKLSEARKWVEEKLLDLIAQEMIKPNIYDGNGNLIRKEIHLDDRDFIPVEAKIIAAREIDGLLIEERWVKGYSDPDMGYFPDRYEYYVSWKQ